MDDLKAVADYWRKVKSGELPAPSQNEISITVCTLDGAVSRIATLLAELESKDKRIAELDAKLSEMTTFRDNALNKALRYWEELLELRSKLATPVRLPDLRQCVSGDRYQWSGGVHNYRQDAIATLREQGFTVGDE